MLNKTHYKFQISSSEKWKSTERSLKQVNEIIKFHYCKYHSLLCEEGRNGMGHVKTLTDVLGSYDGVLNVRWCCGFRKWDRFSQDFCSNLYDGEEAIWKISLRSVLKGINF